MTKFIISLLIGTVFFSCGNSRESKVPEDAVSQKKGRAKMEFLSEMHNFGTLKAGESVSYTFIYKNSGTVPFKISEVVKSCDCLSAKFGDQTIAPGENGEIEIVLNTSGEWGNVLKTMEVHTSAGEKKVLTLSTYIENEQFNNLLKSER